MIFLWPQITLKWFHMNKRNSFYCSGLTLLSVDWAASISMLVSNGSEREFRRRLCLGCDSMRVVRFDAVSLECDDIDDSDCDLEGKWWSFIWNEVQVGLDNNSVGIAQWSNSYAFFWELQLRSMPNQTFFSAHSSFARYVRQLLGQVAQRRILQIRTLQILHRILDRDPLRDYRDIAAGSALFHQRSIDSPIIVTAITRNA